MIDKGPTVYQTGYGLLQESLRGVLWAVVEAGPGAGGEMGAVPWRACAALYTLVEGRLHQPDETLLLDLLARELNQHPRPSPGVGGRVERSGSGQGAPATGPGTTDVLPRIDLDQNDLVPQVPSVSRPPPSGGGRPQAGRSTRDTPTARSVGVRRSG
ncbi:MAG: hypothetical protein ACT4NY_06690 [Pseudonocardiales bacterium]